MWDFYLDSIVYSVKNGLTTMKMFDLAKTKIVIMITITVINKGRYFKGKKTLICSKYIYILSTLSAPRQKKLPKISKQQRKSLHEEKR